MRLSARVLGAYRRTRYSVDGVELRIGHRSAAIDAILRRYGAREGVMITAWNPMSRRMPARWNERMQRRLAERLRRFVTLPGAGELLRWREDHFFVLASAARCAGIARKFRQAAIVAIRVGARSRLIFALASPP